MKHPVSPVTIVIPTLNEEKYLPALLDSILKVDAPLEVIVVDGKSDDKTCEVVERYKSIYPEGSLTLINSERGISRQRNAGGIHAKHPVLFFCDADVLMPSIERYQALLDEFEGKKYVVAAPRLQPIEKTAGTLFVYRALLVYQKTFLLFGKPYFPGSFLITTSETFKKVGGFNNDILIAEDVDYSFRASKLGPFGMLHTSIPVSARRFLKYGTAKAFGEWIKIVVILILGRRVTPRDVDYPFGEFNESD